MHPAYHWTSLQQGLLDGICLIRHPFNQTMLFLQSCFSSVWLLAYIFMLGHVPPMYRILQFLLNFMTFLSSGFSSLLRFLWMEAWIFGVSVTFPSFVSRENLPNFPLCQPSSISINWDRKQVWTQYWSLECTGSHWPPTRVWAIDCLWAQAFSSCFKSSHCSSSPDIQELVYGDFMEDSVLSFIEAQIDNLHHSSLKHLANYLIIWVYQGSKIWCTP